MPAPLIASADGARSVRTPVPRTFILPIATAVGVLAFLRFQSSAEAVISGVTAAVLVLLAGIDIEWRLIPNRLVVPAWGAVLVAQLAFYPQHAVEWLVCSAGAALIFLIPHMIRSAWMGMGDVKLMLLVGAALGWNAAGAILLSFICVFPVALVMVIRGGAAARKSTLPFGPFLAAGALIMLFTSHVV
jgi:prepilin signal peptidase PulO-like enzyme (type II secretory pathway)